MTDLQKTLERQDYCPHCAYVRLKLKQIIEWGTESEAWIVYLRRAYRATCRGAGVEVPSIGELDSHILKWFHLTPPPAEPEEDRPMIEGAPIDYEAIKRRFHTPAEPNDNMADCDVKECEHEWHERGDGFTMYCLKCPETKSMLGMTIGEVRSPHAPEDK